MCVVSMVHDYYQPVIPSVQTAYTWVNCGHEEEIKNLKQQIEDLRKALQAASIIDELTNQSECLDPSKAGLIERVEIIEEILGL